MPLEVRTVSTVEAIAEVLRELILSGELEPGEPLREARYSTELGVARHSFRAATKLLIHEGLIRHEPNRGVHVPVLAAEDVLDIFRLRTLLEVDALRSSVAVRRPPEAAIQAADELSGLADDASWRRVVEPDLRFHRAFIEQTGSPRLIRAYAAVESEIRLCLVQLRPHYRRPGDVAAEHRELLVPVYEGDARAAETLLRRHLDEAAANLVTTMTEANRRESEGA